MFFTPKLKINLAGRSFQSFHFFGVLGFILGTLLGVFLCYLLNFSISVILLMSLTGTATFFLLAILAKVITGKEVIVYYHHEIAILIACSCVLRIFNWPVLQYLDVTILGIATFLAFGRIGCLSVGCCHGRPSKKGITYGHEHVKAGFTPYYDGVVLLPVQLIESIFVFFVVITGSLLVVNNALPGTILIFYTVVYGTFRFMLEFFRGDAERPYYRGLSEAQWTTLLLIAVSMVMSLTGFTPLYKWHSIIAGLLFLLSVVVIFRNNYSNEVTSSRHVKQIAIALNKAYRNELLIPDKNVSPVSVNIFETKYGLNLSKGLLNQNGNLVNHYTISCKKNNLLSYAVVEKLAIIIQQIQKHKSQFEIYERQNAVFHILFKE
jgi:prolipoprotein diacylglyceryltransferase